MKDEKELSGLETVREQLRDEVEAVRNARDGLVNLQKALQKAQHEYELSEKDLTGLLVESDNELINRANKKDPHLSDKIRTARQKKNDLAEDIKRLIDITIPKAEVILSDVQVKLDGTFLTCIKSLRQGVISGINAKFNSIEDEWIDFLDTLEASRREFGINVDWYQGSQLVLMPINLKRIQHLAFDAV